MVNTQMFMGSDGTGGDFHHVSCERISCERLLKCPTVENETQ